MMRIELELNFPQDLKQEPIICELCKKFQITLNIIEASFSTEIGWAVVVLEGEHQELEKVTQYLKDRGVSLKSKN